MTHKKNIMKKQIDFLCEIPVFWETMSPFERSSYVWGVKWLLGLYPNRDAFFTDSMEYLARQQAQLVEINLER